MSIIDRDVLRRAIADRDLHEDPSPDAEQILLLIDAAPVFILPEPKVLLDAFGLALWEKFATGEDGDFITREELRKWVKGWLDDERLKL